MQVCPAGLTSVARVHVAIGDVALVVDELRLDGYMVRGLEMSDSRIAML